MRALALIVAIAITAWLSAPEARALGFVLAGGDTVEGAIVGATRNTITIRRVDGGMRQLPIGQLQRVQITTADGQTLGGRFGGWQGGRTGIETGSEMVWIDDDRVVARAPLSRPALAQSSPPAAVTAPAPPPAVVTAPAVPPAAPAPAAHPAAARVDAPLPMRQAVPLPAAGPQPAALPAPGLPLVTVRTTPAEVGEATGEIVFTVEVSRPLDELLVLIYSTVDGAAHAGSDYAALQGILTLPAGTTRSEVRTAILDDREHEDDEEFNLFVAGNPDLITVAQQWTRVTIHDDD